MVLLSLYMVSEIPMENLKTLLYSVTSEEIENYILYRSTRLGL